MLSEDQAGEIKKQIISQIESTFPAEQIPNAKSQIESMNAEQFENFLKRNNLIKGPENNSQGQCVFCSIASGQINSVKIDENKKAIAVLEINPVSYGHAIIIPKEHSNETEKEVQALAEKVAKQIRDKLNPKKIDISGSELFGHKILNIIPIYENETANSERKQATPEELELIKEKLNEKEKKEIIEEPKTKKLNLKNLWLPRRIP